MSKKTNDLTYLLITLMVCVFPILHFPKMLQVSTLPKFILMMVVALALLIVGNYRDDRKSDLKIFLPVLVFGLWAAIFSWSDIAGGNLTALFGADSGGVGIILLLCSAIFFRAGRTLSFDPISRKNFLWFYTIGVNLSFLVWFLSDHLKDLAARIDLTYLELEHSVSFIDQSTFLVFTASLTPIIFSLIFIEKNKLLRAFATILFAVDMLVLSRIFSQSGDETFFYAITALGVGVAGAGLLDPRRRPLKNAYLKLWGVFIGIAIIIPIAGGVMGLIAGNSAENKVNSIERPGILANAMGITSESAPEFSSHNAVRALTHSSSGAVLFGNGIGAFQQVFFMGVRDGTIEGNFNNFPVLAPTFALEVITIFGLAGFLLLLSATLYFIKMIVSHITATPFFYAVSASAMVYTLSILYVPMNFQSLIIALLLVGISLGQRPNFRGIGQNKSTVNESAADEMLFQKNPGPEIPSDGTMRSQMKHHRHWQKGVVAPFIVMTAIFLAYLTFVAVQDLRTELAYFNADKHDDLKKIREISTTSTQYGAVEIAAARYIIFEGYAFKNSKIKDEGFAILERLRKKDPQELNTLNEIATNAILVNDFELAVEILRSMSELNTSSTNIYNGAGLAYFKNGEMGNALIYFKESLNVDDSSPVTYALMRDVYLALGDMQMAEELDKKGALLKQRIIK